MQINLADRVVGDGQPCLLVAAIGSNHDGSVERARALIDLAADVGADAVKIHCHQAATLLARRTRGPAGEWRAVDDYARYERLELPADCHATLRNHAAARGLTFLATPFDDARAGLLAALGVAAFRVTSGDLTHVPLLETLGRYGRPILLSTGLGSAEEIADAIAAITRGAGAPERRPPVVLLHCVTGRPAPLAQADLRALSLLRTRFDCLVGCSDHSDSPVLAVGAAALGACIIERHLTDDPARPGEHHAGSIDGHGFAATVAAVRELEAALGGGPRAACSAELERRREVRRSVHAARSLPAGSVLDAADLKVVRPAVGARPGSLSRLVGTRLTRPVAVDEPIGEPPLARPRT